MKNNGRLRLSFSLLLLASQGRWNEAVDLYTHKDTLKTKQMEDGVAFHKQWAKEIKDTKKLKIGKTELSFINPQPELEITVPYNDRWDLKGHIDCVDLPTIYEWKTGVMSSLEYAISYQVPLYFLLGSLSQMEIDRAVIYHFNQYKNQSDVSIVWNGREKIDKAHNFIESLAPEIEKNFIEAGLILPLDKI